MSYHVPGARPAPQAPPDPRLLTGTCFAPEEEGKSCVFKHCLVVSRNHRDEGKCLSMQRPRSRSSRNIASVSPPSVFHAENVYKAKSQGRKKDRGDLTAGIPRAFPPAPRPRGLLASPGSGACAMDSAQRPRPAVVDNSLTGALSSLCWDAPSCL